MTFGQVVVSLQSPNAFDRFQDARRLLSPSVFPASPKQGGRLHLFVSF